MRTTVMHDTCMACTMPPAHLFIALCVMCWFSCSMHSNLTARWCMALQTILMLILCLTLILLLVLHRL